MAMAAIMAMKWVEPQLTMGPMAGGAGGFGQALEKAGPAAPTAKADRAFEAISGGTTIGPAPAGGEILGPKVESVGRALETVKAQAKSIQAGGLQQRLTNLETRFQQVGRTLGTQGEDTSPMAMLQLQGDVYQIGEELELLSKVVEQMTSGVKTVLQMQV